MLRAKRDPAFLHMAVLAGSGGVAAIAFSIGLPLYSTLHGHPTSPASVIFAAWGACALAGAYACLQTYAISDTGPRRPPRGGLRVITGSGTVPVPASRTIGEEAEREAA